MALFFFFFLLLFSLISPHLSSAASDTITASQPISGGAKLVSAGDKFELGFFQPGNSPYFYIGIWYSLSQVPELTPVWVANRATPISDRTATQLKISPDGNLVLSNRTNPLIWSTNISISNSDSKSTASVAVLLDTGNLVLKDGPGPNSNSNSTTLWQSFDNPTHTWLPGGKLGLNKVTGQIQRLFSWKSLDDPAPGLFSLQINPNYWLSFEFFILWNSNDIYWTSGTWNGRIFSLAPEMTSNYIYNFYYVSNERENYFFYSIKKESSLISRLIMDVSGQIKQLTWINSSNSWILFWSQSRHQCQVYAFCGPFGSCNENALPFCSCLKGFRVMSPSDWASDDFARGCARNTPLQCGGGNGNSSDRVEKDRFYAMSNMRLPDNAESLRVGSAAECESGCLSDCSCIAYSFGSKGCSVWHVDLLNLQDQYQGPDGGTVSLRLAASELPDLKSKERVLVEAIVAGVAGGLGMLAIAWLLIWQRRRRRRRVRMEGGLAAFRYGDLQRATKNFSKKLGGGAFGSVFKGVLPDTTEVAVKKLQGLRQGEKQFRAEVSTIGTIQHVNLVRLRGFCSHGTHKLLVYEYMPNGSLDAHLFEYDESGKALDWRKRYQIALGTARGLTYLHEQCRDCIVHCDIKPENILVDASFVPKVADFGLAKLIGRDFSRVLTTMRGTIGYLAPEWISGVAITAKADVYSYGMMMFEIISGKRNSQHSEGNKYGFFPLLAANKLMEGDAISLLDSRLAGDADMEEVIRACKVACWCIQDDENSRPSMGQVVQILEGVLEVDMPPIPRWLQILAGNPGSIPFFLES